MSSSLPNFAERGILTSCWVGIRREWAIRPPGNGRPARTGGVSLALSRWRRVETASKNQRQHQRKSGSRTVWSLIASSGTYLTIRTVGGVAAARVRSGRCQRPQWRRIGIDGAPFSGRRGRQRDTIRVQWFILLCQGILTTSRHNCGATSDTFARKASGGSAHE
jgi:hypothetical protein